MGVSGCGKSEIGKGFARAIGGRFFDGDDLHPAENIAKMSRGEPLDDNDRAPWLDKVGRQLGQSDGPTVIACSALKRAYRQKITEMAERPVTFLYLEGTRELLSERMGFNGTSREQTINTRLTTISTDGRRLGEAVATAILESDNGELAEFRQLCPLTLDLGNTT